MEGKLTKAHRDTLRKWIGTPGLNFKLLFSIEKDGCNATTFHQKCDQQGPTVTVVFNTTGNVYGGYTSQSWHSASSYVADAKAFLFNLETATKFPMKSHANAILGDPQYGPTFGSGHDMMLFSSTINRTQKTFQLNSTFNLGKAYDSLGFNSAKLNGGNNMVTDLQVFSLQEKLKNEVVNFKPDDCLVLSFVRILLIGPVGSGKSSFYNTINSVFRGRVSCKAPSGSVQHSLTTQYRAYKVRKEGGEVANFRLCDTMGLEDDQGMDAADVALLLDGNVPDRHWFHPDIHLTRDIPGFKSSPQLKDRIHCVAFVMDSGKLDVLPETILRNIQSMRQHIKQRGVPIVVLLTKVDTIFPCAEDLSKIFYSTTVCEAVDKAAHIVGIPRSQVLPLKNYDNEVELDPGVDTLALLTMRQMLGFASDFLCHVVDSDAVDSDDATPPSPSKRD